MRIFYQHDVANTRIGQAGSTRALSDGRLTLAIRHSSQLNPNLVASNMLNTTTAIVSPGKITSIAYTPFGFAHQEQQTSVGFNGEYPDPLTGNYGLGQGYRWYSPTLKRFQAADDISPFGPGGISAYAYTHNDPVNKYDPDGHQALNYFLNLIQVKSNSAEGKRLGFYQNQPQPGKKPRLYIHLHGNGEAVSFHGNDYNPKEFIGLTKQLNINIDAYKDLFFTTCYAGETFASEVARLTNKTVIAPVGVLTAGVDYHKKSDTYDLNYLSKPDAGFFPQDQLAPSEDYVFGLKTFTPMPKAYKIRG